MPPGHIEELRQVLNAGVAEGFANHSHCNRSAAPYVAARKKHILRAGACTLSRFVAPTPTWPPRWPKCELGSTTRRYNHRCSRLPFSLVVDGQATAAPARARGWCARAGDPPELSACQQRLTPDFILVHPLPSRARNLLGRSNSRSSGYAPDRMRSI